MVLKVRFHGIVNGTSSEERFFYESEFLVLLQALIKENIIPILVVIFFFATKPWWILFDMQVLEKLSFAWIHLFVTPKRACVDICFS